jgi:hypothetical protein
MEDDLEERLKRLEADERRRSVSWPLRFLFLALVSGLGGILYIESRQDQKNIAENGVLLPHVLIQKATASRRDLALLDRSLHELAVECEQALSRSPGPGNRKRGERFLTRLASLRKTGRELEPKLSREESRVLMATEHAESLIDQFIRSSYDAETFDRTVITTAEKQLERARALARGQAIDPVIVPGSAKLSALGEVGNELKAMGGNLKAIQASRAREQAATPKDALYVPGIDSPRKKK